MRKLLMTLFIVVLYTACRPIGEPVNIETTYPGWTFEQNLDKCQCVQEGMIVVNLSKDDSLIKVITYPRFSKYQPGDIIGEVKSEDVTETFEEIVNE